MNSRHRQPLNNTATTLIQNPTPRQVPAERKPYAIFDMDGTLLDSMPYWNNLGKSCLTSYGIPIPDNLEERVKVMTLAQSAAYFVNELGLPDDPERVAESMRHSLQRAYGELILPKPGAIDYLRYLQHNGVRICVATATALTLANTCLQRLGILPLLEFVVSCEEAGANKHAPDVYHLAVQRFAAAATTIRPEDVAVYEDACHAAQTARAAGFYTMGVHDPLANQERLRSICHRFPEELALLSSSDRESTAQF